MEASFWSVFYSSSNHLKIVAPDAILFPASYRSPPTVMMTLRLKEQHFLDCFVPQASEYR